MDLLTTTDLTALADHDRPGPAVSLFTPTNRVTDDLPADRLRWKNVIAAAATALRDDGVDTDLIDTVLAPARELHAEIDVWQHMSDGLAMFLRPNWHQAYRVPVEVPQLAVVGDRFVVSPLVRAIASDDHFLLLAVSQRNVRLFEGTAQRVEAVELRELPTSSRDIADVPDERSNAMARPLGGGSTGPAVFHGHGAADDDFKNEELVRFFRQVSDGLHDYLADQTRPMVLVGLDRNVSTYRDVNTYANVLGDDVDVNPDQMTGKELHDAAWPIAAQRFIEAKRAAIERFNQVDGTGVASADEAVIASAAEDGRVDTLFVASAPSCWDRMADSNPVAVRLGAEQDTAGCELLDRAMTATLLNAGQVYPITDPALLGGRSMAATFRY